MNKQQKVLLCNKHYQEAICFLIEPGLPFKDALLCFSCLKKSRIISKTLAISDVIFWMQETKDEALSRKFEQISILQKELQLIQEEIMEYKNRLIQLCDLILWTTATWLENLKIAPQLSVFEDLEIFYSNNFHYFYEQDLEKISSGFLRKLNNVFDQILKNKKLLEIQERLKEMEQRQELKKQITPSQSLNKYQLRTQKTVPKIKNLEFVNPHYINERARNYQQQMKSQDEQFSCFRKINERVNFRNNNQKTHKVDSLEKLCLNDNESQMICNEEIKNITKNSVQSLQINPQHIINLRLEKFNSIIACSKELEIAFWVQQNQHYILLIKSLDFIHVFWQPQSKSVKNIYFIQIKQIRASRIQKQQFLENIHLKLPIIDKNKETMIEVDGQQFQLFQRKKDGLFIFIIGQIRY